MATPTRTTRRVTLPGAAWDLEVLTSAPASPAVLLLAGPGAASGDRVARRLARAGFTVVTAGHLDQPDTAALRDCLATGGLEGVRPTSVAIVTLPLPTTPGREEDAVDALVRDLAARLT